jgi:hypothetical protein
MELKLKKLSIEETINHSYKEYNQTEWQKIVNRFAAYGEIQFFERIESPNQYTEIFAVYVADGIRFFNSVAYSSCLSNGSFAITHIVEDGNNVALDYLTDKTARLSSDNHVRQIMRELTKLNANAIFTKVI